jgi:site-specific DNA recombinase
VEQRGHRTKKVLEVDPIQAETVRLIFRLAREGDGMSGPMGVKSITTHLNAVGIRTRDGGRWGIGAVHKVVTRTTYVGRHRFNTKFWKTRKRKPADEVVETAVPAIIDPAEYEAVQALLKTRSPALTAPRITSGPTLLTGICFCAACGMAMTLRTGKGGRYRYYTCSTKARQGETGCKGRTVPMEKLDSVVADHIEHRLLQPKRLEEILASVLDRREDRAERRAAHIAELRKRAAEADGKLKRLYDAIESGVADLSDPMLKQRVAELKAIRDQARADAERAQEAIERTAPIITPHSLKIFARQARKGMRTENGGYRRDHLRALAQRVEVDAKEVRIMGSKSELLRTLVAASSAKTAGFGVPSFVPNWRAIRDSNSRGRICKPTSRHLRGPPARSFKAELTSCSGRVRAIAASSLDAIFPCCLRQALRQWSCAALMRGSRFANGNSDETVRLRPFSELLQGAAARSAFAPGARNCAGQHIQRGGRIAGVPCQESHGHRAASRNRLRRMPSRIECHPRVSRGRHTLPPGSRHGPRTGNALVDV